MSLTIHDKAAFSYTADQIIAYIDDRCAIDKVISCRNPDDIREVYTKIFKPSLTENRSSRLNECGTIFSVSVRNLFGEKMPIVDFYTAMGFLVSETDPVPESLSSDQKHPLWKRFLYADDQHDTMLINFSKWCTTMYTKRFETRDDSTKTKNDETLPNTACLGWIIAPDGQWSPQVSSSSKFPAGRTTFAAVFTNMHEPNKAQMKKEVKNALERLLGPLTIAPRVTKGRFVDYGHCAENLVFQFYSHMDDDPLLLIYGTAVDVRKFLGAIIFDVGLVKRCCKAACENCVSLVAQASANHPAGLQFYDLATLKWHVKCVVCKTSAVHTCWCQGCHFHSNALYCSEEHRLQAWRMYHYRECSYKHSESPGMRMCANCLTNLKQPMGSQARKCSDCGDLRKAPWYCSLVCQEEHSAIHQNHCATRTL